MVSSIGPLGGGGRFKNLFDHLLLEPRNRDLVEKMMLDSISHAWYCMMILQVENTLLSNEQSI